MSVENIIFFSKINFEKKKYIEINIRKKYEHNYAFYENCWADKFLILKNRVSLRALCPFIPKNQHEISILDFFSTLHKKYITLRKTT